MKTEEILYLQTLWSTTQDEDLKCILALVIASGQLGVSLESAALYCSNLNRQLQEEGFSSTPISNKKAQRKHTQQGSHLRTQFQCSVCRNTYATQIQADLCCTSNIEKDT